MLLGPALGVISCLRQGKRVLSTQPLSRAPVQVGTEDLHLSPSITSAVLQEEVNAICASEHTAAGFHTEGSRASCCLSIT